jgi:hypothetical protein
LVEDSLQLCRNLFHQLAVGTCELVQVKLKLWGWRRLKEIASEKQKKPTIRSITEIEEHTCMAGREKSVEKEIVLYSYVPPDPPPPSPSPSPSSYLDQPWQKRSVRSVPDRSRVLDGFSV